MITMEIKKNKLILTIVLIFTFVVAGSFILIFVMNRPTLVLSDMVSYAPATVEISSGEDINNTASITDESEIEQLLTLLEAQTWKSKKDITYNSEAETNFMCVPTYYIQLNDYQIQLLCKDDVEGYSKIEIRGKEYLYTIPLNTYNEIEAYAASHKEDALG